jgi:hypothetical protein
MSWTGSRCPDEGLGLCVVVVAISVESLDEFQDTAENASLPAHANQLHFLERVKDLASKQSSSADHQQDSQAHQTGEIRARRQQVIEAMQTEFDSVVTEHPARKGERHRIEVVLLGEGRVSRRCNGLAATRSSTATADRVRDGSRGKIKREIMKVLPH